jgi:hypothetical protein
LSLMRNDGWWNNSWSNGWEKSCTEYQVLF